MKYIFFYHILIDMDELSIIIYKTLVKYLGSDVSDIIIEYMKNTLYNEDVLIKYINSIDLYEFCTKNHNTDYFDIYDDIVIINNPVTIKITDKTNYTDDSVTLRNLIITYDIKTTDYVILSELLFDTYNLVKNFTEYLKTFGMHTKIVYDMYDSNKSIIYFNLFR